MSAWMFLLGGLVVLIYGIRIVRESREMATWPTVPGRIVSAEARQTVRAARSEDQRYMPEITFEFAYEGTTFRGDRHALVPTDSRGMAGVNAVLQQYPVGQHVQVHVNPKEPARSVLNVSPDANQWAYAIGGLCLIGVGVYLFVVKLGS